jgi:hypothetical protein
MSEHPQRCLRTGLIAAKASDEEGGLSVVKRAGVDWTRDEHGVHLLEDDGRLVSERRFAHDERGLAGMDALLTTSASTCRGCLSSL